MTSPLFSAIFKLWGIFFCGIMNENKGIQVCFEILSMEFHQMCSDISSLTQHLYQAHLSFSLYHPHSIVNKRSSSKIVQSSFIRIKCEMEYRLEIVPPVCPASLQVCLLHVQPQMRHPEISYQIRWQFISRLVSQMRRSDKLKPSSDIPLFFYI